MVMRILAEGFGLFILTLVMMFILSLVIHLGI